MFSLRGRRAAKVANRRGNPAVRIDVEDLEGRVLLAASATDPINFGATITSPPVVMNGQLFFAAYDPTHGYQLWKVNGTSASQVSDGHDKAGGLNPSHLTVVGNTLYFAANDGVHGTQLWKSDGTGGGTAMVTTNNEGLTSGISPTELTNVNGTLYFVASDLYRGSQVFKSNGTAASTVMVAALNGGSSAGPSHLTAVGSTLFFQAF